MYQLTQCQNHDRLAVHTVLEHVFILEDTFGFFKHFLLRDQLFFALLYSWCFLVL